ncbi:flavin reductase family protein [Limimaricola sp.]|uniref:flavin reductase family protein n=1 Tax=Limimaricola sp. TaxID=2211665 RepID=UPI0040597C81
MTLTAKLIAKTGLSAEIAAFRFAPLAGRFTGMSPGAHVDIHLGADLVRQYSLCDWDAAGGWVELASCGTVLPVGPEQSILGVLRDHGLPVAFGCAQGLSGSCMTDMIAGEIDHRDGILSPEEQAGNGYMCICVSRAKSARLVLDM